MYIISRLRRKVPQNARCKGRGINEEAGILWSCVLPEASGGGRCEIQEGGLDGSLA